MEDVMLLGMHQIFNILVSFGCIEGINTVFSKPIYKMKGDAVFVALPTTTTRK